MGWEFPYVSTYETDFPWDFEPRDDSGAGAGDPRGAGRWSTTRPSGSRSGREQVGAELKDGLREGPGWIAFARENGTVYHTYTVMAPGSVRRPVLQLPARPHTEGTSPRSPRSWRKDEYPD